MDHALIAIQKQLHIVNKAKHERGEFKMSVIRGLLNQSRSGLLLNQFDHSLKSQIRVAADPDRFHLLVRTGGLCRDAVWSLRASGKFSGSGAQVLIGT